MSTKPKWRDKHPCEGCGTGYGDCASLNLGGHMCCVNCKHPTRWVPDPYTDDEYAEMRAEADAKRNR